MGSVGRTRRNEGLVLALARYDQSGKVASCLRRVRRSMGRNHIVKVDSGWWIRNAGHFARMPKRRFPSAAKADSFEGPFGTAEAVPLQSADIGCPHIQFVPTKNPAQASLERGTQRRDSYFDAVGKRPRYFSMGWMLGGAPRQASYILPRSSVLPRESTIWRKRSPLARVRPPCSTNHW